MFVEQNNFSLTSLTLVDPVFDFQFRIILVGESTVGKTSLLRYLFLSNSSPSPSLKTRSFVYDI